MEKLENWKIAKLMREMWRQSEERLFKSIFKKASRNAIVKNRRCWHMWKKNKNKTSRVSTISPARSCRGMQCARLVIQN